MVRAGVFAVLAILLALATGGVARAEGAKKVDYALLINRSGGGLVDPKNPFQQYSFSASGGAGWEFKGGTAPAKKGKLAAEVLQKWVKEIKEGGFDKLKSNPALGAADEPFMEIIVTADGKTEKKKIRLGEKVAQAIEKKVKELVKAGK